MPKTYLIITAAVIPHLRYGHYEGDASIRLNRYIESIPRAVALAKEREITPVVVENSLQGRCSEEFLSKLEQRFGCKVIVMAPTPQTDVTLQWKAVLELEQIKHGIESIGAKPEDMIVKLTGRYSLESGIALDSVMDAEAAGKSAVAKFFNVCTKEYVHDDCVLGLIAARVKHLAEFNYITSPEYGSPEVQFARYLRSFPSDDLLEVRDLGMRCVFGESGEELLV